MTEISAIKEFLSCVVCTRRWASIVYYRYGFNLIQSSLFRANIFNIGGTLSFREVPVDTGAHPWDLIIKVIYGHDDARKGGNTNKVSKNCACIE